MTIEVRSIRASRPGGRPATGPALHLPPQWVSDALCAQTDPEAFFPEKGGDPGPDRRICADCPVRARCRDYALSSGELYGVWGGLTLNDRRRLRRRARRIGVPVTEVTESGRDAA